MSKKVKFEMAENLLLSVIKDQTGSVVKAVEECLQNSLDADSTRIDITINENGFRFVDDGCGMNKKQIDKYFRVFGNSAKKYDKTKIGKFGMGRGQVFNFGYTTWKTKNFRMLTNIHKSLSYRMKKLVSTIKGTDVSCVFFKSLGSYELDRTKSHLKQYFLPEDVEFYINGEKFVMEKEVCEEYTNEEFEVFLSPYYNNRIFSQKLFVKTFDSTTKYNINCLKKMELNFARNSFKEDDDATKRLFSLMKDLEKDSLVTENSFDASTGERILGFVRNGKLSVEDFKTKKIIELADGNMVSLESIATGKVMFGDKNETSDRAIQQGHIVINNELKYVLNEIAKDEKITFTRDYRDPNEVVSLGFKKDLDVVSLKKKHGKKAVLFYYLAKEMNKVVFNGNRDLKLGESDIASGWTDGYYTVWINKNLFMDYKNTGEVQMRIYELLIHEYAHEEDDTNKSAHDVNFYKRYHDMFKKTAESFGRFNRIRISHIKELYDSELTANFNNF